MGLIAWLREWLALDVSPLPVPPPRPVAAAPERRPRASDLRRWLLAGQPIPVGALPPSPPEALPSLPGHTGTLFGAPVRTELVGGELCWVLDASQRSHVEPSAAPVEAHSAFVNGKAALVYIVGGRVTGFELITDAVQPVTTPTQRLTRACTVCGDALVPDATFCVSCGQTIRAMVFD
jgi:hypothetical protein